MRSYNAPMGTTKTSEIIRAITNAHTVMWLFQTWMQITAAAKVGKKTQAYHHWGTMQQARHVSAVAVRKTVGRGPSGYTDMSLACTSSGSRLSERCSCAKIGRRKYKSAWTIVAVIEANWVP